MLGVIMLSGIRLNVTILRFVILGVIELSVLMLNITMMSVNAKCYSVCLILRRYVGLSVIVPSIVLLIAITLIY